MFFLKKTNLISIFYRLILCGLLIALLPSVILGQSSPGSMPNYLQNMTAPSVNNFAFSKINHVPTNPFTGQTKFSLPLYEKKMSTLKFALSLDYIGSGGIKSQDPGSIVANGWHINGGGIIMRTRRGMADNFEGLTADPGNAIFNGSAFTNNLVDIPDGNYMAKYSSHVARYESGDEDSQLDIYEFNINGRSGKFYIGRDKTIVQVHKSGLKIIPTFNVQFSNLYQTNIYHISSFKVIDESGIQYIFNQSEMSYYYPQGIAPADLGDESNVNTYRNNWMLTKIQSPDSLESINIEYYKGTFHGYSLYNQFAIHSYDQYNKLWPVINYGSTGSQVSSSTELDIKSITFSDGDVVKFTYFDNTILDSQYDPYFPLLRQLTVNRKDRLLYGFGLDYMGYQSMPQNTINYTSKIGTDSVLHGGGRTQLYLKGIRKFSPEGNFAAPYTFEYYLDNVINRLTIDKAGGIDHWGYFNGKSNDIILDATLNGLANRAPNSNYTKMGVLKKITFPTGGTETFSYEINDRQTESGRQSIGGLRLKTDSICDGLNPAHIIVKSYKYTETNGNSSGFLSEIPAYNYTAYVYKNNSAHNLLGSMVTTFSQPINPVTYVEGSPVGYRRVEESIMVNGVSNGKIVHEYSDLNYLNSLGLGAYWDSSVYFPYRPVDRPEWILGLPLKTSYFTSSGVLVNEVSNTYNCTANRLVSANYKSWTVSKTNQVYVDIYDNDEFLWLASGVKVSTDDNWSNYYFNVQHYYPVTGDAQLATSTTTSFPSNGGSVGTVNTTSYTYDPANALVRTITKGNSKGETTTQNLYYPTDYNLGAGAPLTKLAENNEIADPVMIDTWLSKGSDKSLIASTVTEYAVYNNLSVRPSNQYKLNIGKPIPSANAGSFVATSLFAGRMYSPDIAFTDYDAGRLTAYKKSGGTSSAYILDAYSNILAQVENASLSNIAYANFESDVNGNWSVSGTKSGGGLVGSTVFTGTLNKAFDKAGNFVVTLWSNTGTPKVNNLTGTLIKAVNGYSLYKWVLYNVTTITVTGTNLDEVKCYPSDAMMSTNIFNERSGLVGAFNSADQLVTYSYDEFDRPTTTKNENGEITKSVKVKEVTTYFNDSQSRQFSPISCLLMTDIFGYGTWTIPKGRYSSVISQVDANLQALAELDAIEKSRPFMGCVGLDDFQISAVIMPAASLSAVNGCTNINIKINGSSIFLTGMHYFITYRIVYSINGTNYTDTSIFADNNGNNSPQFVDDQISTRKYYNVTTNINGQLVQQNVDHIVSATVIGLQYNN